MTRRTHYYSSTVNYIILFISAFGAATLLPISSEVTLVALLTQDQNALVLWIVATIGNTLGAIVNWLLGRYLLHFQHRRWFPFKPKQLYRAQHWFQRYGIWSLLLSWLPIIGDALTCIAGIMRVRFWPFIALTTLAKGGRYAIVILAFVNLF